MRQTTLSQITTYLCGFLLLGFVLSSCEHEIKKPVITMDSILAAIPDSLHKSVDFYASDSLLVRANLYFHSKQLPNIIFCHQAGFNKFEYDSIAEAIHLQGYNCLVLDQRSGGTMQDGDHSYPNVTNERAIAANKPTDYISAEQDIRAAIDYLYEMNGKTPIVLWGSSYSATLALHIGLRNARTAGVVAFSPGDYLKDDSRDFSNVIKNTIKPYWIASSREEAPAITAILDTTTLDSTHVQFIPTLEGKHGSKALWLNNPGQEEYWESLWKFLDNVRT